ncbi:hypothetical protein BC941DRAFT_430776 [Chlamydoabsidia padenii]|nr:hypothetical protein BC941DRAFT_430776 [Chlamydoabsidia padenii]
MTQSPVPTTPEQTTKPASNFTPSLGLRYWMNKMIPDSTEEDQQRTNHSAASSIVSNSDTTKSNPLASSSLRVHYNSKRRHRRHSMGNDTLSEQSSVLSDDIQSTASIKSQPWISQAIPTADSSRRTTQDSLDMSQRRQHRRRWSENELFPLGRIKAGLGRLVLGREHSSPPATSH